MAIKMKMKNLVDRYIMKLERAVPPPGKKVYDSGWKNPRYTTDERNAMRMRKEEMERKMEEKKQKASTFDRVFKQI